MSEAFESLVKTLAYMCLSPEEQQLISRLELLEEEFTDLKGSAKFNREQWLEWVAIGKSANPEAQKRKTKYESKIKRMREVRAEINQLKNKRTN